MKKIKVVCSGYFNPLHVGHLDLLKAAKKLGDILIVVINSDQQVKLKGSIPFMNENDRARIISSLKYVDQVLIAEDEDRTIRKELIKIKPDIYANGGDVKPPVLEQDICDKYNIRTDFNVGGGKIEASSMLIKNAKNK